MSSIDAASTNDVSSTARSTAATEVGDDTDNGLLSPSPTNQKAVGSAAAAAATLTSDGIIKECIKQGFYRNPVCNEKLYLHNKGYTSIAPTAFELYTDVKVLWLEGNALAALPCGGELVQTEPPRNKNALYPSSSSSSSTPLSTCDDEEEHDEDGAQTRSKAEAAEPKSVPNPQSRHADPLKGIEDKKDGGEEEVAAATHRHHRRHHHAERYPSVSDVAVEDRDAFSSLYPTVRQLYLHNNIFRTMPDISRFERLDAVNLANNFIAKIEPHCPSWDKGLRDRSELLEEAERAALGVASPVKSPRAGKHGGGEEVADDVTVVLPSDMASATTRADEADPSSEKAPALSAEEAKQRRAELLARYEALVQQHLAFCPHPAMPEMGSGAGDDHSSKPPLPARKRVPVARKYRSPCSSLRTLNLAANHLQSFDDVLGLLCYKALSVLDLSQNRLDDGEALLLILERLTHLKSLKLSGNPLVRTLPKYRKTVLARCPTLLHLDDRPVFTEERRLVTAWARGGDAAEAEERKRIKEENDAAVRKRVDDFRQLLDSYRAHDGEGGGAPRMHPSHMDYIRAITHASDSGGAGEEGQGMRKEKRMSREARQANSDPDQSPTSSEEDEDSEVAMEGKQKGTGVTETAPTSSLAAATATANTRVLSCNGPRPSARAGKAATAVLNGGEEEEEDDMADVYLPS